MSEFQWISVKEREPECGQRVIAFCPADSFGRPGIFAYTWRELLPSVTHWCEMPPLPGEERKVYTNCVVASSALSASDFWKRWAEQGAPSAAYIIDSNGTTCQLGGSRVGKTLAGYDGVSPEPCPDCKGTRQYQPLFGPAEPCRTCCK